jgi:hypothetical protein
MSCEKQTNYGDDVQAIWRSTYSGTWEFIRYGVPEDDKESEVVRKNLSCLFRFFYQRPHLLFKFVVQLYPNNTGYFLDYIQPIYFTWQYNQKTQKTNLIFVDDVPSILDKEIQIENMVYIKTKFKKIPKCDEVITLNPVTASYTLVIENGELQYLDTEQDVYLQFEKTY